MLTAILPSRTLGWHYRSRDERLIAFSNAYIYDQSLVTFPGVTAATASPTCGCPRRPGLDADESAAPRSTGSSG